MEDIKELCDYIEKIANMHKSIYNVKFSINPVVPKPHTPLQWTQYNYKDIRKKSKYIKKRLKKYDINIENPKKSLIQYILSCGDENIGEIILKTQNQNVTIHEWMKYTPKYNLNDELPWDKLNVGVKKDFLIKEFEKIKTQEQTPWCEISACYNCGACEK